MFRLAAEPKRCITVTSPVSAAVRFRPGCLSRNLAITREVTPTPETSKTPAAGSASARLQALLNEPATRAAATVARDPGYAAVAAALYQSAALFRFQTGDPGDALPTGNVPIPGVTRIQGIPPLNAV